MDAEDRERIFRRAKELHKGADEWIAKIYRGKAPWAAGRSARTEKLGAAYALLRDYPRAAEAWTRLLNRVGHGSDSLSVAPAVCSLGARPGNTAIDALIMLALRSEQWQRPPEAWATHDGPAAARIGSLARHLLCRYHVPAFMDSAWFEGFSPDAGVHQDWFVHVGCGGNIRRAELPVHLTERAAHHFLLAPLDSTIVGALRFGQVRALGGGSDLVRAVAASRLGAILPDEPFWSTVIHFFVNQRTLNMADVGPIVDFLVGTKFGSDGPGGTPGGDDSIDAPEPGLTMKGRTLPALLRRIEEWRERLSRAVRRRGACWSPSGIAPFRMSLPDSNGMEHLWIVRELLNSTELAEEGNEQRNCVSSYQSWCVKGGTSIWSLRVRGGSDACFHRILTIEVDNRRRAIVQVRAKCDKLLAACRQSERVRTAGDVLHRWARDARLSVCCAL